MEIHKPKPVHNWRELVSEIGVVVIGIIIALSLEAAVEALRWRHEVGEGREHLREEIKFDERVYIHRVDVASCVKANLSAMKTVVEDLQSNKHVKPIPEFISPENGPIHHEIWNALTASQVLVHFPREELAKYSQFYQDREDAEYFMDRESRAWRQLHLLEGDPKQLSHQDISTIRVALGDAMEMSTGVGVISRSQVDVGRVLGIRLQRPSLSGRPECKPIAPPQ